MEVHAHTHTARKKWTHYLWEFIMLFLAVTLGFLVENIREHRIEKKRAKAYAHMLKNDLAKDITDLDNLISKKDSVKNDFSRFTKIIDKQHEEVTFADLSFIIDNKVDILKVFASNDVAYSQLKNSGGLRYFENMELIGKLGSYDAEIKQLQNDWNNTKELFGGIRSSYLLQLFLHINKFLKTHPASGEEKRVLTAGYDFQSFDEGCQILNFLMWFQDGVIDLRYKKLKKKAIEIIALLDEEYHIK